MDLSKYHESQTYKKLYIINTLNYSINKLKKKWGRRIQSYKGEQRNILTICMYGSYLDPDLNTFFKMRQVIKLKLTSAQQDDFFKTHIQTHHGEIL